MREAVGGGAVAFWTGVDARKLGEVLREAIRLPSPERESLGRSFEPRFHLWGYATFAYSCLTVRVYGWSGAGTIEASFSSLRLLRGVEPVLVTATASKQELSAIFLSSKPEGSTYTNHSIYVTYNMQENSLCQLFLRHLVPSPTNQILLNLACLKLGANK